MIEDDDNDDNDDDDYADEDIKIKKRKTPITSMTYYIYPFKFYINLLLWNHTIIMSMFFSLLSQNKAKFGMNHKPISMDMIEFSLMSGHLPVSPTM